MKLILAIIISSVSCIFNSVHRFFRIEFVQMWYRLPWINTGSKNRPYL